MPVHVRRTEDRAGTVPTVPIPRPSARERPSVFRKALPTIGTPQHTPVHLIDPATRAYGLLRKVLERGSLRRPLLAAACGPGFAG